MIRRFFGAVWHWLFGWRTYKAYLGSPTWRKLQRRALERDGFRCRICNTRYELHVHNRRYARRWGLETVEDLTTLCGYHHRLIEADRLMGGRAVR